MVERARGELLISLKSTVRHNGRACEAPEREAGSLPSASFRESVPRARLQISFESLCLMESRTPCRQLAAKAYASRCESTCPNCVPEAVGEYRPSSLHSVAWERKRFVTGRRSARGKVLLRETLRRTSCFAQDDIAISPTCHCLKDASCEARKREAGWRRGRDSNPRSQLPRTPD